MLNGCSWPNCKVSIVFMQKYGQYDHLGDKLFCLSQWPSDYSFNKEDFKKEEAKCRGLCPNHHNLHTYYQKEEVKKKRTHSQKKDAIRLRKTAKRNQDYVNQVKVTIGQCQICQLKVKAGEESMFQFDHNKGIIPEKNRAISLMIGRCSIERIKKEIALCRLICFNCAKVWDQKQKKEQEEAGVVLDRSPVKGIKFKLPLTGCVTQDKSGKRIKRWFARGPTRDGKRKHIGIYLSETQAREALSKYKRENPNDFEN